MSKPLPDEDVVKGPAGSVSCNLQARARADRGLAGLWTLPIRGPLDRTAATAAKPVGELTMPEVMDWAVVLGYAGLTGYVIGKMAGNLLEVMLGGRRR